MSCVATVLAWGLTNTKALFLSVQDSAGAEAAFLVKREAAAVPQKRM